MAHIRHKLPPSGFHALQLVRHGIERSAQLPQFPVTLLFIHLHGEVALGNRRRRCFQLLERLQSPAHKQEYHNTGQHRHHDRKRHDPPQNFPESGFDFLGPRPDKYRSVHFSAPGKRHSDCEHGCFSAFGTHADHFPVQDAIHCRVDIIAVQAVYKRRIFLAGRYRVVDHSVLIPVHYNNERIEFLAYLFRGPVQVSSCFAVPVPHGIHQALARQVPGQVGDSLRFGTQVVQSGVNLLVPQCQPPDRRKADCGQQNCRHHHSHNPRKHSLTPIANSE